MAMPFASPTPAADHRPSSVFPFCRSAPLSSAAGEEAQQHVMSARWAPRPAPFTAAQYEELEQQALIYKYLLAGVPVPPDLLLPIRRGFDSLPSPFYHHHRHHHHSLGYGSYLGKKLDPEPGRCRRTDGKKWRCSKEAAPDSKYCERHMHRGRNRSRKPVETQLGAPQSQQQPQAAAPATATGGGGGGFQNQSMYPEIASSFALGSTQLQVDSAAPYATGGGHGSKDLRFYSYGVRSAAADEQSQLTTGGMDTSMDYYSWWPQTSASSYPLVGALSHLDESTISSQATAERKPPASLPLSHLDENTISSQATAERVPPSFFGSDAGGGDGAKQESQTLRHFFDEWPKARNGWPELADDTSRRASFSATQLSISIPMANSDFSNAVTRSPNGIYSR